MLDKTTTDFSSEEKERLLLSDDEEQRSLSLSLPHFKNGIICGCKHVAFLQKQTILHAPNRRLWVAPFTKETESDSFPMRVGGV
jgi:hypothetical protein|tara:strand:+ start:11878 stop:12129 length:252 start_codon:yes stop_codon:yes gene_type:complete